MSRPQNLADAAAATLSADKEFANAVDEFLDDFYLNPPTWQTRIDAAPPATGEALQDAWLGAAGEHLARRWGLVVPPWTERPQHFRLAEPTFLPASPALQAYMFFESPLA